MDGIFVPIAIYLGAAVIAVPLAQRIGFGSVLGYLAAGLAFGPVFGLVGGDPEAARHFAEFGVVLMLFLIGLELDPSALWAMRRWLIGLGGLQVALTLAACAGAGAALGLDWRAAVAIGIVLCLSSTALVMQTLQEKKLAHREGGRAAFAVLLFQDIAVIPLLAILPLLAAGGEAEMPDEGLHAGAALLDGVAGWSKAALVIGAVLLVVVAGRFLTRPLYRYIAMARMPEMQTAAALLFVIGIALVMDALGLSPALGSFLAGVVLAQSEYRHALEAEIAPFKGLLLGLFFFTVGASLDLDLLAEAPLRLLALTVALMALKIAVLYPVAILFGLDRDARLLFALALGQAGEFAFFLLTFAVGSGVIGQATADTVGIVVSLSMFLTPALFLIHDRVRTWRGATRAPDDEIDTAGPVIIAGMGRFGLVVNRLLVGLGEQTVVLDSNPDTISKLRTFGVKGFYGHIGRAELFQAAGIDKARAVVVAVDDPALATRITRMIRRRWPEVKVIARARDRHHVYELYAAGTELSVREVFDSAVRAGKYALAALGYAADEIDDLAAAFVDHDRSMLAELAALWDPKLPPEKNRAYVAKAREQSAEIEAMFRRRRAAASESVGEP